MGCCAISVCGTRHTEGGPPPHGLCPSSPGQITRRSGSPGGSTKDQEPISSVAEALLRTEYKYLSRPPPSSEIVTFNPGSEPFLSGMRTTFLGPSTSVVGVAG